MAKDYNIDVQFDMNSLVHKLLNNDEFTTALAEIIRSNILKNARSYGTVLGGYAGTNTPAFQNLTANAGALNQAAQGSWQTVSGKRVWVHN